MWGLDDLGVALEGTVGAVPGGGFGLLVLGAALLIAGPRAKPLAKQTLKGAMAAGDRVREWTAEAAEQMQDLYAEAKHEYEVERSAGAAAGATGPGAPAAAR